MTVHTDEVARIAALARLRVDSDELDRLTADLNRILEHVDALRGAGGEPEASGPESGPERASTRPPEAEWPDRLIRPPSELAPRWAEGFFVVPPPPGVSPGAPPGDAQG